MASFNTTVRQMTEMFHRPKFFSKKWPKCLSIKTDCQMYWLELDRCNSILISINWYESYSLIMMVLLMYHISKISLIYIGNIRS